MFPPVIFGLSVLSPVLSLVAIATTAPILRYPISGLGIRKERGFLPGKNVQKSKNPFQKNLELRKDLRDDRKDLRNDYLQGLMRRLQGLTQHEKIYKYWYK